jgi:hypothetical protein
MTLRWLRFTNGGAGAAGRALLAAAGLVAAAPTGLSAQKLHVNDRWDDCAMVLAPSLTQGAWRQFVREAALVVYFRPLASARPLGRRSVELSVLQWSTRIDDMESAWNDTFTHPDSLHWLFDGDALPIPGLMLRAGVTDRADAGVYFTKAISANYGFLAGQVQYSLLDDSSRNVAVAARATAVRLLGPDDLTLSVYGIDLVLSRSYAFLSPYAGVSGLVSRGRERTSKVDLDDETVFGVQGSVGAAVNVRGARLGAELNLARVTGYSIKVGYAF